MPFKSEAQRRKFYQLKKQGKMSQQKIDEWESETPKNIPKRVGEKPSVKRAIKVYKPKVNVIK